jgi:hypothetical protein
LIGQLLALGAMVLRATRSFVLHLEQIGRGMRPTAGKRCADHQRSGWVCHSPQEQATRA